MADVHTCQGATQPGTLAHKAGTTTRAAAHTAAKDFVGTVKATNVQGELQLCIQTMYDVCKAACDTAAGFNSRM